jgi:hypothetical protein
MEGWKTYGGVGVGVNASGDPIAPGVAPVGVLMGSRTLERFFAGPPSPMLIGAAGGRGEEAMT